MEDAALLHTILCGAALYADVVTGRGESLEKVKHMKESVHLLNQRLRSPKPVITDSTIVTVAHLAEYEVSILTTFSSSTYLLLTCKNYPIVHARKL